MLPSVSRKYYHRSSLYIIKATVVAVQKCEVSVVCSEITPSDSALGEVERIFTLFCIVCDFR